MSRTDTDRVAPTATELDEMHDVFRQGGGSRRMAPHVVYRDATCPHDGCQQQLQAIDFRLEAFGKAVHDPLVTAWWNDTGFAGRCPGCGGWVHFTIRAKRPIDESAAQRLPQLPNDWSSEATIL